MLCRGCFHRPAVLLLIGMSAFAMSDGTFLGISARSQLAAGVMLLCWSAAAAAGDDGVKLESVPYAGWKHNLRLSNGDAEFMVTLDVGPRILSYRLQDG